LPGGASGATHLFSPIFITAFTVPVHNFRWTEFSFSEFFVTICFDNGPELDVGTHRRERHGKPYSVTHLFSCFAHGSVALAVEFNGGGDDVVTKLSASETGFISA